MLRGIRDARHRWRTEAMFACEACGRFMGESRLLRDDDDTPMCRYCGSLWVEEIEGEDYGQGRGDDSDD